MAARLPMRKMAVPVLGLKMISVEEQVQGQHVKTHKKDTRVGKTLLVPMNSKSLETSVWG